MTQFTDAEIIELAQEAEISLAAEGSAIVERTALPIVRGVSQYNLPELCHSIMQVTYRGYVLDPHSGKEMIWSQSYPGNSPEGIPKFYINSYQGQRVIKFYPTPPATLPTDLDPWSDDGIAGMGIVEYYSLPDFSGNSVRYPITIRRQYVKSYVMYRLLKREGKMMDIKTSKYFDARFKAAMRETVHFANQVFKCVDRHLAPNDPSFWRGSRPAHPVLPTNFGPIVGGE